MAELKIKPMGLRGGKDPSMWEPTRTGYMNKVAPELGHAEREWHSTGKEQNEHSPRAQREEGHCGTYWKSWQPGYALRTL